MEAATALAVAGRVASAASDAGPPDERALAALEALRDLVPYVAAELSWWDPVARAHRTLVNDGYSEQLTQHFNGSGFLAEVDQLGMRQTGSPKRMRDVPEGALAQDGSIRERLRPAGYREGLTMVLRTADGRCTGMINLSVEDPRHPTDVACATLTSLNGALANLADPTRSCRWLCRTLQTGVAAAALTAGGESLPLAGVPGSPLLLTGTPTLAAAADAVRAGSPIRRFLTCDAERRWWRIVAIPCREPGLPAVVALVTAEVCDAHGLTRRELEVLTLLADGRSNADIAARSWSRPARSRRTWSASWTSSGLRPGLPRPASRYARGCSSRTPAAFPGRRRPSRCAQAGRRRGRWPRTGAAAAPGRPCPRETGA